MCDCNKKISGMAKKNKSVPMETVVGLAVGGGTTLIITKQVEKVFPSLAAGNNGGTALAAGVGAAGAYASTMTKSNFLKGLAYGVVAGSGLKIAQGLGIGGVRNHYRVLKDRRTGSKVV